MPAGITYEDSMFSVFEDWECKHSSVKGMTERGCSAPQEGDVDDEAEKRIYKKQKQNLDIAKKKRLRNSGVEDAAEVKRRKRSEKDSLRLAARDAATEAQAAAKQKEAAEKEMARVRKLEIEAAEKREKEAAKLLAERDRRQRIREDKAKREREKVAAKVAARQVERQLKRAADDAAAAAASRHPSEIPAATASQESPAALEQQRRQQHDDMPVSADAAIVLSSSDDEDNRPFEPVPSVTARPLPPEEATPGAAAATPASATATATATAVAAVKTSPNGAAVPSGSCMSGSPHESRGRTASAMDPPSSDSVASTERQSCSEASIASVDAHAHSSRDGASSKASHPSGEAKLHRSHAEAKLALLADFIPATLAALRPDIPYEAINRFDTAIVQIMEVLQQPLAKS